MDHWKIPDPPLTRLRCWLSKRIVCPLIGHRSVRKFSGTILCRWHD